MKSDMRIIVTKRLLREGLLRCLKEKPLSRITISDLCRESGVNRATFYNHYSTPAMILREIAYDYAEHFTTIYKANLKRQDKNDDAALEACLTYISENKKEIKLLFSDHAENYLAGACMEIIGDIVRSQVDSTNSPDQRDEWLLRIAASASAVFGFLQIWITMDIDKTPGELVKLLKSVVRGNII